MREKNQFKKTRLEEKILYGLNLYLRTEMKDPRVKFVSFTKVELIPDLSVAKIYWDTFDVGTRGDAKKGIDSTKGRLRHHLAETLNMRVVPELVFSYDASFEATKHIEDLLQNEYKNLPEKDPNES